MTIVAFPERADRGADFLDLAEDAAMDGLLLQRPVEALGDAIAVAAVGITAAAALGVASLSQNKHSTAYHDRINQILVKAMDLGAALGNGIGNLFSRLGTDLESGASRLYTSITDDFLAFSLNLGNHINGIEGF